MSAILAANSSFGGKLHASGRTRYRLEAGDASVTIRPLMLALAQRVSQICAETDVFAKTIAFPGDIAAKTIAFPGDIRRPGALSM
jgi:hypothetical protein